MAYLNRIQELVDSIIGEFNLKSPPVDLDVIIDGYEIAYREIGLNHTSGYLLIDPILPLIVVNRNHILERRRFTTAHELGHLFLNHSGVTFEETGQPPRKSDRRYPIEKEADLFAVYLLMPADWVHSYYAEYANNPRYLVENLASIFVVSKTAMEIRLKELGLAVKPRRRF